MQIHQAIPTALRHWQQRRLKVFDAQRLPCDHLLEKAIEVGGNEPCAPSTALTQRKKGLVGRDRVGSAEVWRQDARQCSAHRLATTNDVRFQQTDGGVKLPALDRRLLDCSRNDTQS